jgi:hypothetical protein
MYIVKPAAVTNIFEGSCLRAIRVKKSPCGPSIDASYQVSVHLAEGFQRRRLKCEKLTDDRRRTPSDGKSSHCLWQSELKMYISNLVLTPSPVGKGCVKGINIETPSSDDVLCFVYNLSIHQLYNVRNICLYNVWLTVLLTQA